MSLFPDQKTTLLIHCVESIMDVLFPAYYFLIIFLQQWNFGKQTKKPNKNAFSQPSEWIQMMKQEQIISWHGIKSNVSYIVMDDCSTSFKYARNRVNL
jgi:hypothetical protein